MHYRKFGKLDFEVSSLGFGAMRLPIMDDDKPIDVERDFGQIDEEKAIKMIHYAIDNGINYVDTAYPYHDGNSEILVGKALKNGYREKVKLTSKLPVWLVNKYSDFEKLLDEQLERLNTEYLDFYILHSLNKYQWNKVKKLGVLKFIKEAKEKGKIKHTGFSFHDGLKTFKEIVDSYDWDMCQIQYNYMDEFYQAGKKGLKYAAAKGLAVVIMEPLRGGKLVKNIPDEAKQIWDNSGYNRTSADWAFRWVLNHPEVTVILSGMNKMEEIEENINTFSNATANSLSDSELATINEVKEIYKSKVKVDCTECGYCIPCPVKVKIPDIFTLYNNAYIYGTEAESKSSYERLIKAEKDATACVECGECEEYCPQNISIMEALKEAHAALTIE